MDFENRPSSAALAQRLIQANAAGDRNIQALHRAPHGNAHQLIAASARELAQPRALRAQHQCGGADPARDTRHMQEARAQEQRFGRLVAERKGQQDERMQELRWLLEELRVSFFAQELRTPQPVSLKRLEKVWAQVGR